MSSSMIISDSSDSLADFVPIIASSFIEDQRLSPQLGDLSHRESEHEFIDIPEVPEGDIINGSEKFSSDHQLFLSAHEAIAYQESDYHDDNNPIQGAFLDDSTQGSHSGRSSVMYPNKTKGSFAGIVAERRAVAATRKAVTQAMRQMGKQDPFQKVNRGLSVIVAKHRMATGKLSPVSSQSSLVTMAFSDVNYSYAPLASVAEQQGIYQEKSQSTLDENTSVDDVSKIIRAMRRDITSSSSAVITDGGSCDNFSPIPIPQSPSAVQPSTLPTQNLESTFDDNHNQKMDCDDDISVSSAGMVAQAVMDSEAHSQQPSARR